MTQQKGKGTTTPRNGRRSAPTSPASPYGLTPSPVGSARPSATYHQGQTFSKRLFKEEEDNSNGWDSLEDGIWEDIIQRVERVDKVSVVHIGMCSRNLRTIVTTKFAPTMSLESMYVKLPGMSPKLLHSMKKWWEVHSNADAGIMLGMYLAWYEGNWPKGLETLIKVADATDDPQAIYLANIIYRSKHCCGLPPPPAGHTFTKGGKHNHMLIEYRTNMERMVNCVAMRKYWRRSCCSKRGHVVDWTFKPASQFTCEACVFDAVTFRIHDLEIRFHFLTPTIFH